MDDRGLNEPDDFLEHVSLAFQGLYVFDQFLIQLFSSGGGEGRFEGALRVGVLI